MSRRRSCLLSFIQQRLFMKTKLVLASLLSTGVLSVASSASAGSVELGAEALVLPTGKLTIHNDDLGSANSDSRVAYGVSGLVDYVITPYLSVGFAPRYVMNIKSEQFDEDADGAQELDLAVRVTGRAPIGDRADLFVYGAPGYSFIFLPDNAVTDEIDSPQGFLVGVGGGAHFKLTPSLSLIGEVGYSFGFQQTEVLGQDVDAQTDLMHVGVGVQAVL
jgi:hypothetical protein